MADPIIIETPEYLDSTYTSAVQPAIFKVQNTKFPVNSEDAVISLSSGDVGDNFGFTTLDLSGSGQTFEVNDYLKITNEPTLNGVYRIQAKDVDKYTIGLAYQSSFSTLTPDVQKYYNNYFNEVLVYAIKEGDVSETQIGETSLKAVPVDNVASFNISGLLKSELGVDYNATRFYIEFRETFDEVVNGIVQSTDNTYLTEEANNCVANQEYHTNADMQSDATWTLIGGGSAYNAVNQSFDIASSSQFDQISLRQTAGLPLPLSDTYNVRFTIDNPNTTDVFVRLEWLINDDASNPAKVTVVTVLNFTAASSVITYNQDLTLNNYKNYDGTPARLFIQVIDQGCNSSGACGNLIQLEQFSVRAINCQRFYYGVYGVNQFQDDNGFNFRENTAGLVSTYNEALFQSEIQCFRYFPDNDLKISYLINPSLTDVPDSVFEEVSYYDVSGNFIVSYAKAIPQTSIPTEELDFNDLVNDFGIPSNAYSAIVRIYYVPDNLMTANDSGTFDDCNTFDFAVVNANQINCDPSQLGNTSELGFMFFQPTLVDYPEISNGINLAVKSAENISLQVGEVYELEAFVGQKFGAGFGDASVCLMPFHDAGGGTNTYTDSDFVIEQDIRLDDIDNVNGNLIRTTFTALTSDFNVAFGSYIPDGGVAPTIFAGLGLTNITARGPRINLTKDAKVLLNKNCINQEIQLKWYNSKGGWEYFTFTARKSHSYSVGQGEEIKKDVYLDFINGKSEYEYTRTEVRPKTKVRSQYLTKQEVEKIALIKESIEVQDITGNKPVVVQVSRDSLTYFNEGEKLYVIEFDISYPSRQTVSR